MTDLPGCLHWLSCNEEKIPVGEKTSKIDLRVNFLLRFFVCLFWFWFLLRCFVEVFEILVQANESPLKALLGTGEMTQWGKTCCVSTNTRVGIPGTYIKIEHRILCLQSQSSCGRMRGRNKINHQKPMSQPDCHTQNEQQSNPSQTRYKLRINPEDTWPCQVCCGMTHTYTF